MKYTLKATIPCGSFANLQPEVELEGDNLDDLHATAEAHIQKIWDQFGERPLKKKSGEATEVTSWNGEKLLYNDEAHAYFDLSGNRLLSGSAYAESMTKPFDKVSVLKKASESWGVDVDELSKLWDINGRISTEYGSSIHTALETYHLYKGLGAIVAEKKKLDYNYALPKIPFIRDAVLEFDKLFGTDALTEVLVSDVKNLRAGRVDRLSILDEKNKVCRIGDYKTNFELDDKKIQTYQHQLSFYADIMVAHGWSVTGLDIYHFSGGWEKIELPVLPVSILK